MQNLNGKIVAFLGPDGAGKSTMIELVQVRLAEKGIDFSYHYFAPGFLKRYRPKGDGAITTKPHEGRQYGAVLILAKILLMLFEFRMGVARLRRQPRLALFDRYVLDILIDPKRYRMGHVRWWMRVLLRLAPPPDLLVIVSAPADLIQSRKQEVPAEETVRQVIAYEELADIAPRGLIVHNTTTPDAAVSAVLAKLEALS
ncbi:hypothetical protein ACFQ3C_11225 [Seohaeicola saemankumensis]|uniref:Thymidylate kinase n=1 Tax=Seohaeicola saemankumensis TaxID=481181 RepID=A0ABW3TDL3_9RHOB